MLTFCRCLTCLKQDVMYSLLYAALHHGDMIGHICMTDMTSLISFLFLFHSWAAFVVCQQNWVNNTTWNSLTNIFSVHLIQVGSFWVCSRIGVQKYKDLTKKNIFWRVGLGSNSVILDFGLESLHQCGKRFKTSRGGQKGFLLTRSWKL